METQITKAWGVSRMGKLIAAFEREEIAKSWASTFPRNIEEAIKLQMSVDPVEIVTSTEAIIRRRDVELLKSLESMLDNDNCSKHWSDGCRICARDESIYDVIKLIKGE